jgi:hypothetical protein
VVVARLGVTATVIARLGVTATIVAWLTVVGGRRDRRDRAPGGLRTGMADRDRVDGAGRRGGVAAGGSGDADADDGGSAGGRGDSGEPGGGGGELEHGGFLSRHRPSVLSSTFRDQRETTGRPA